MADEPTAAPIAGADTPAAPGSAPTEPAQTLLGGGAAVQPDATKAVPEPPKASEQPKAPVAWRDGLSGEELEVANRYASNKDAMQAIINFRKAQSTMIRVPGKDAKPEELASFRKAIGVPEKPDAYSFAIEGRETTDADKAVHGQLAQILHEHNVPAAAAPALAKAVSALAEAQEAEANRVALKARADADAELRKEMGADYEPGLELAKRAARTFGDEALSDLLNNAVYEGGKAGDHPAFIKAFMKIGRRMGEGEFIGAVGADQRQSLQDEYQRIMRENPPGTDKYKSPAVQRRLAEINQALATPAAARRV